MSKVQYLAIDGFSCMKDDISPVTECNGSYVQEILQLFTGARNERIKDCVTKMCW